MSSIKSLLLASCNRIFFSLLSTHHMLLVAKPLTQNKTKQGSHIPPKIGTCSKTLGWSDSSFRECQITSSSRQSAVYTAKSKWEQFCSVTLGARKLNPPECSNHLYPSSPTNLLVNKSLHQLKRITGFYDGARQVTKL